MKIALDVAFLVCVVGWGIVLNYCSRYDKVISWAVGYVAPTNLTKQEANTYRAALSPRLYLRAINLQIGMPILILILGTIIKWYMGVLGLIVSVMLIYAVLSVLKAGTIESYLYRMIMDLQRRVADYKRVGDVDRKEAAEDMLGTLKGLYEQIRGKNYRIPPSGSIEAVV